MAGSPVRSERIERMKRTSKRGLSSLRSLAPFEFRRTQAGSSRWGCLGSSIYHIGFSRQTESQHGEGVLTQACYHAARDGDDAVGEGLNQVGADVDRRGPASRDRPVRVGCGPGGVIEIGTAVQARRRLHRPRFPNGAASFTGPERSGVQRCCDRLPAVGRVMGNGVYTSRPPGFRRRSADRAEPGDSSHLLRRACTRRRSWRSGGMPKRGEELQANGIVARGSPEGAAMGWGL